MFDHVGIFVTDPTRSFSFYEAALAPLAIIVHERQVEWGSILMAGERRRPFLWIGPAGGIYHGTEVKLTDRRPVPLAFRAQSKAAVEKFYDNGRPEDCGRGAYGAYLLDPDGNNVEAVYRETPGRM
jgi:catechol 2,3-dioxygenase-like lactoylglutathione lyase family enzyme